MSKILFITSYYPPEKGAAAARISETARYLAQRGHDVSVLTTVPNYPTGIVPPEYRGRLTQEETLDGIRVARVWSYTTPNKGFFRRVLAHLSFGCLTPLLGWKMAGRPDILIVESHPLFNAIAGRLFAWGKRCPFVFTVSDLWPESAIQLGVLRNPVLIWLAERLEWSTYRRARLIWALTGGIQDHLLKGGLAPEKVLLLTNGTDTTRFRPLPQAPARAELGWDDRFVVLYAGTHGLSHRLSTVLNAAKRLREREDIHFVFAGDGAEKASLVEQARRENLTNVTFMDPVSHEMIPQLLAAADVCLVHARKVELFEGMLPIKMYEAMSCARPILLGVSGEARKLAEQDAGAARYFEPENDEALAEGVLYLLEHPEERALLGQRGRKYVETYFDREKLTAKLDERIAGILGTATSHIPETPAPASLLDMPVLTDGTGEAVDETEFVQAHESLDVH